MRHLSLITCLSACLLLGNTASAGHEKSINRIVATVNGELILQSDIDAIKTTAMAQMQAQGQTPPPTKALQAMLVKQTILKRLQLQLAKSNNITISDKQLQDSIARIAKRNHWSIATLKKNLRKDGHTFSTFKNNIREQLTLLTLQRGVVGHSAAVSAADIAAYRQKHQLQGNHLVYNIGDILVALPEKPSAIQKKNAQARIQSIYQKLKKGASFERMAKLESSRKNAASGSTLGYLAKSDIPDLFFNALRPLRVGHFSKPLQAGNGWHIVTVLGTKKDTQGVSDQNIRQMLAEQKAQATLQKWYDKLVKESDVQTF